MVWDKLSESRFGLTFACFWFYNQTLHLKTLLHFLLIAPLLLFTSLESFSQNAKVIHWKEMEQMLTDPSDSLTVINFWATWCKPCVAEIPHFEEARKTYKDKPVRFWYVSLDFKDDKKKLDGFVKKRMSGAQVFLLDETDYNKWIDKVEPSWQGGIPITLILNNVKKYRKFVNSEMSAAQLNQIIQSNL